MTNFEELKAQIKQEYKTKMESVNHWEKVCKEFQKHQRRNVDAFSLSFPHTRDLDNEAKIEAYANEYGFTIAGEELGLLTSVYSFKRKD